MQSIETGQRDWRLGCCGILNSIKFSDLCEYCFGFFVLCFTLPPGKCSEWDEHSDVAQKLRRDMTWQYMQWRELDSRARISVLLNEFDRTAVFSTFCRMTCQRWFHNACFGLREFCWMGFVSWIFFVCLLIFLYFYASFQTHRKTVPQAARVMTACDWASVNYSLVDQSQQFCKNVNDLPTFCAKCMEKRPLLELLQIERGAQESSKWN